MKKTTNKSITINKKPSVLFVASECNPFAGTGGLADVMGSLPKALSKNDNFDVRVVIPLYQDFSSEYKNKLKFLGNFNVPLSWRNQYAGVFSLLKDGVTYYFIDNEYYFKRAGLYGFYDDAERFAYYSKATLYLMKFLDFYPNVLHAQDWQTALSVVYLKTILSNEYGFDRVKAMFTIHNIEYQGKYGKEILGDVLGLDGYLDILEFDGCLNFMKGAMVCADKISTVSPSYASEIKYDFFSHGLSPITNMFAFKTLGILNGIDEDYYNPTSDTCLFSNYSACDTANKAVCKKELQKMLCLPERDDVPLVCMISRLVSHKGLDLVKEIIDDFLTGDVQFVILGKGEKQYEDYFKYVESQYSNKCRVVIAYNKDLSSKIYSGADIFLMPSKQEPCGLSQMIAAKYGTVPVVRKTGGLADSIIAYNRNNKDGNGFNFENYNAYEMLYVLKDAVYTYKNKDEWNRIVKSAMTTDFSWNKSAKDYEIIYNELI